MSYSKKNTLATILDETSFGIMAHLRQTLPSKNTTWSNEAKKIQFRINRKKFKKNVLTQGVSNH